MKIQNIFITPPPRKLPCPLQIVPPLHLQSLETINLFLVFCSMYCFPESYIYVESVCRLLFLAFFMHVVVCIRILFYSYVLLYGYAIFIHSLVTRHLDCFQCLSIMNKASVSICIQDFCERMFSFLLGNNLAMGLQGHMNCVYLILLKPAKTVSQNEPFCIPISNERCI